MAAAICGAPRRHSRSSRHSRTHAGGQPHPVADEGESFTLELGADIRIDSGNNDVYLTSGPDTIRCSDLNLGNMALQVGWNVRPRIVLAGNIRGIAPYSKKAPREARGSPVGLSDRVTYLSYGPTVILGLGNGAALQLDVDGASRARNLANGTTVRLGVSLSR